VCLPTQSGASLTSIQSPKYNDPVPVKLAGPLEKGLTGPTLLEMADTGANIAAAPWLPMLESLLDIYGMN
jgi:hypothetical protein